MGLMSRRANWTSCNGTTRTVMTMTNQLTGVVTGRRDGHCAPRPGWPVEPYKHDVAGSIPAVRTDERLERQEVRQVGGHRAGRTSEESRCSMALQVRVRNSEGRTGLVPRREVAQLRMWACSFGRFPKEDVMCGYLKFSLFMALVGCSGSVESELTTACTPPDFAGYHMTAHSGACGDKFFNPAFDQGYLATIIGDDSADVELLNGRCTSRLTSRGTWMVVTFNEDWSSGAGDYQEDNCHYSVKLVRE